MAGLADLLGLGDFRCIPSSLCIFIFLPVNEGEVALSCLPPRVLEGPGGAAPWSSASSIRKCHSAEKKGLLCSKGRNLLTSIGCFLPAILKLPESQADHARWNLPCQSLTPPEVEVCPSHQAPPPLPAPQEIPLTPGDSLKAPPTGMLPEQLNLDSPTPGEHIPVWPPWQPSPSTQGAMRKPKAETWKNL